MTFPQIIRKLRADNSLSQQDLADYVDIARATYVGLENGRRDPNLSEIKAIAEYYQISPQELIDGKLTDKKAPAVVILESNTAELTQVVNLNKEKFREVVLYILNKVGAKPNVGETVLYKLLYFIDFDYYEQKNTSITGMQYVKNHFGPTPRKRDFDAIIDAMSAQKEIELIKTKYATKDQKKYLPAKSPQLTNLSADEIKHIDEVLSRLSDKNATELSDLSHRDMPWIASDPNEVIDYDLVFYRTPVTARSNSSDDPL